MNKSRAGGSLLDRFLRLFADVRAGEAVTALLLTANVFLLLTAYYLLKTAREPLILTGGGAEVKAYAAAGQSVLLIPIVKAYGHLAERFGRLRLIASVNLFFAGNLALFFLLGRMGVPLGIPFFVWVGIFNVSVVAQFWSFANDVYDKPEGERLFPIVGIGSSVGAVAGARIAKVLFRPLGPFGMMAVAAFVIVGALGITLVVHRREAEREAEHRKSRASEAPIGKEGGFSLIFQDRYLLLVAALTLLLNWVNTTGEYVLDRTLVQVAAEKVSSGASGGLTAAQLIGEFKAEFFGWVNLIGVGLQLFVVSRVIKYIGVRGALFVLPLIALGGYAALLVAPVLAVIKIAKIAENSVDYSLQNTARQALFLPTSREAKYKAKAVIDTFVVRLGDVLAAVLVWIGVRVGATTKHFVLFNLVLAGAWLGVVVLLARAHRERTREFDEARPASERRPLRESTPSLA